MRVARCTIACMAPHVAPDLCLLPTMSVAGVLDGRLVTTVNTGHRLAHSPGQVARSSSFPSVLLQSSIFPGYPALYILSPTVSTTLHINIYVLLSSGCYLSPATASRQGYIIVVSVHSAKYHVFECDIQDFHILTATFGG